MDINEERRRKRAETQRIYRERKRLRLMEHERQEDLIIEEDIVPDIQNEADIVFERKFKNNVLGFERNVCDRIWFEGDLRNTPNRFSNLLAEVFPNEDVANFKMCQTCYASVSHGKIPRLSKSNGFKYPDYHQNLPALDIISERLLSPRIPFMQIRRLRYIHGSKSFALMQYLQEIYH